MKKKKNENEKENKVKEKASMKWKGKKVIQIKSVKTKVNPQRKVSERLLQKVLQKSGVLARHSGSWRKYCHWSPRVKSAKDNFKIVDYKREVLARHSNVWKGKISNFR